ELELSQFTGRVPVEVNAGTPFPPIGELTYLLTLPPYGFYWFALAPQSDCPTWHTPAPEPLPEFVTVVMRETLAKAMAGPAHTQLEREALPQYIAKRRWSGLRDQTIKAARIATSTNIGEGDHEILLTEIEVKANGAATRWLLPLGILWGEESAVALPIRLALARVRRGRRCGLLSGGCCFPDFARRVACALLHSR